MALTIRTCRPDEREAFFATLARAFGGEPSEEDVADGRWERLLETDRMYAAFDGDRMVATAADFAFTMTVPGGEVETAGVTMVGVMPTHRRRGILRDLMRRQLDAVRERGQPLAILYASEGQIYPRFGYGLATLNLSLNLDHSRARLRDGTEAVGTMRLVDHDEAMAILPAVHDRIRTATSGMTARDPDWWRWHTLIDRKNERGGGSPYFHVVWDHDGEARGYALYRVHQDWEDAGAKFRLDVREALAETPEGTRELWRYLFGVDLVTRITSWLRPANDPLLLLLAEPRRPRMALHDGLWLRLVDVAEALRRRGYAADGTVIFDLTDAFCPWNAGLWRLTTTAGGASVEPASGDADLGLDVTDLASTYLGGFGFGDLHRAGRVAELRPGAVDRADALFRTRGTPYHPEIF
jgi:predicted acetyltransferase